MSSTYSPLKIELIATGTQVGAWGDTTNTNLGTALEEAIVGRATANFPTDANLTLTLTNTNATQIARNLVLNCTSSVSLTVTRDLSVPAIEKPYIIQNNTTGSQAIRVIVAGASVTVPNGKTAYIYNDGTNIRYAFDHVGALDVGGTLSAASVAITGGTIDGTAIGGVTPAAVAGTTATFSGDGTFTGTGQVKLPVGDTAQRSGSPVDGMIRYNTDLDSFEGYVNGSWGGIGGAQAGGAIMTNKDLASVNYTIATGENGLSVGPLTIASGVTITVDSGQRWVVI